MLQYSVSCYYILAPMCDTFLSVNTHARLSNIYNTVALFQIDSFNLEHWDFSKYKVQYLLLLSEF